jgi:hypothetical protein
MKIEIEFEVELEALLGGTTGWKPQSPPNFSNARGRTFSGRKSRPTASALQKHAIRNSGDSSQALDQSTNDKTLDSLRAGRDTNKNEITPRFRGIAALKAPQPQSTLTKYYTSETHATTNTTNSSMRTKSVHKTFHNSRQLRQRERSSRLQCYFPCRAAIWGL